MMPNTGCNEPHMLRLLSPLMLRKQHRCRLCCCQDRGQQRRKLTNGMEEGAARREDDNKNNKGRLEESGRADCCPGRRKTDTGSGAPSGLSEADLPDWN